MDEQILLGKITQVLDTIFPKETFLRIFYEDKASLVNFFLILDKDIGTRLTVDFMDELITFEVVRLQDGQPYKNYYFTDQYTGTIRLFFQAIFNYFQFASEKRSKQLMYFKKWDDIPELIRKNIEYYRPIFQNEKGVLTELHRPETWEKIKLHQG